MKLVLAEKPSVGAELARVLGAKQKHHGYFEGNGYLVTWSLGHLLTLKMPEQYHPEWKEWSFETLPMIPERWKQHHSSKRAANWRWSRVWPNAAISTWQ